MSQRPIYRANMLYWGLLSLSCCASLQAAAESKRHRVLGRSFARVGAFCFSLCSSGTRQEEIGRQEDASRCCACCMWHRLFGVG
jgi:hypothetical protein